NNNSQTADILNSDSIIEESSYHKSTELNLPLQAPQVTNKSAKLNSLSQSLPVDNETLPITNKSADNESTKLNSSIQAPPVAVPKKSISRSTVNKGTSK
ncbi:hypothetical protein RhiirB3_461806, partial [Rhizophagus irregularis]